MKMPVSIPDILNIATDMQEVKDTPISVSLVIDPTAPGELSGHVRASFASEAANTRVRINYIDDAGVFDAEREGDDIAVLVAGDDSAIGHLAQSCRDKGVPAMVVTDDAEKTSSIAKESGFPIPAGDIILPVKLESQVEANVISKIPLLSGKKAEAEAVEAEEGVETVVGDDADTSKIELDADTLAVLDSRMGKWIIAVCPKKDLAFAYSFPFIRRPLAMESITMTSCQNGAIGLVPFLPGADMPVMTLNQIKMTLQIATAYGQPVDKDRIKEIVAVIGGAFLSRHLVRSVSKLIPGVGWLASGVMGFLATEAMGRALLEYFEAGGDIVGAANVLQTARDAAVEASKTASASPLGQKVAQVIKEQGLRNIVGARD